MRGCDSDEGQYNAMATGKYLIINADDFGQTEGISRGILEAHQRGIVTSTSMMVRFESAKAAAQAAAAHPRLSIGLHLDLGEWAYRGGQWEPVYEVVPVGDAAAIELECRRQLERFQELMGRNPTHVDTHQHVHRRDPTRSIVVRIARELKVPLRHENRAVWYCGFFWGQHMDGGPKPEGISVDWMVSMLRSLPTGFTEFGCHPGYGCGLNSSYRMEREVELAALCDARVREAVEEHGIELRSYAEVPAW